MMRTKKKCRKYAIVLIFKLVELVGIFAITLEKFEFRAKLKETTSQMMLILIFDKLRFMIIMNMRKNSINSASSIFDFFDD